MRYAIVLALLALSRGNAVHAQSALEISLAHESSAERATRDQLLKLVQAYDVSQWLFTRKILIDERAIPHSHPVLTLHTRHLKDDDLLLSTFVHEQLHWYVLKKGQEAEDAKQELRALFPRIPVGYPNGSNDEEGNYTHLLVTYLEYDADKALLGELRARQVLDFWAGDHYTWIYTTLSSRGAEIRKVVSKYKLFPPNPVSPRLP